MAYTNSLLRAEEYQVLSTLTIQGAILDVGGVGTSDYHVLIKGDHTITVANLDENCGADLVFDAEETWPIETKSYDAVLLINILEHLYNHRVALNEAFRVLAPEGRVHIVVPFMFNVHASPNDYFRYTRSALTRLLTDAGFTDVYIEELGSGAFSVIYHTLLSVFKWPWLAVCAARFLTGLDMLRDRIRPGSAMAVSAMPLGYYATARR